MMKQPRLWRSGCRAGYNKLKYALMPFCCKHCLQAVQQLMLLLQACRDKLNRLRVELIDTVVGHSMVLIGPYLNRNHAHIKEVYSRKMNNM